MLGREDAILAASSARCACRMAHGEARVMLVKGRMFGPLRRVRGECLH
jgi:hypothetical protein